MKKLVLIGLLAVLCASCRTRPNMDEGQMMPEEEVIGVEAVTESAPVEYVSYKTVTPSDSFYRSNITVKAMGKDYVIYEYSDVKIEEVATLASHYCYETNPGKNAYLRDIYMHKNHTRRATFDCVDLASK